MPLPQQEQPIQPSNPCANLTQQQLLQLHMKSMNAEIMGRKPEKPDNMCKAMSQPRSRKSLCNDSNDIYIYMVLFNRFNLKNKNAWRKFFG